jgi:hypothetical protein
MQIRYLEAMQAMAKSANSKVIFLPATNQTMPNQAAFDAALDGAKPYEEGQSSGDGPYLKEFGGQNPQFQQAMNARVIENI